MQKSKFTRKTSPEHPHAVEAADQSVRADWSAYAKAYDLLSKHNPEYQALLQDFEVFLANMTPPKLIYDIGGGTGNYTEIAARACPGSEIHLVEPDASMISLAKAKLAAYGDIKYDSMPIEGIETPGTADLVVCVHALYAMPAPEQRLSDLRRLLRPGGWLYLVDLGRQMDVGDWRGYLFSSLKKEHGLLGAFRILWQGREIAKQNKAILNAQKKGVYWTHTEVEIATAVNAAGFEILGSDLYIVATAICSCVRQYRNRARAKEQAMNSQVIKALKHSHYKILTDRKELEEVYRLRYKCYRAEEAVPENEHGIMTDDFDETANCVHVAVEMNGDILASVRLHMVSSLSVISPTLEVFPELLEDLKRGKTLLDPTRFVIDPEARKNRVPLHFLALRVPFLAAMFYDIDLALAPVRAEHTAFYRRYLGYELTEKARSYPGLKRPVQLLTADVREQRDAVLARTPVFGQIDGFPQSNIAFPDLSDVYVASKRGRSAAA